MEHDSRSNRADDTRPRAFALLDEGNDAATRLEGVEALGTPSSSMVADERQIADRLLRVVLTDEDAAVRAEAIDALYFHGDRYVDELVSRVAAAVRRRDAAAGPETVFARWLTSDHAAYRMVGATGLGATGSPDATDRLREAFGDGDARVRARSVRAYAELGGDAVAPIRPLLGTRNALVCRAAVDALVTIGTSEAVTLLSTAADAGSERLRRTVVTRLYGLDRPESAAVLLRATADASPEVRYAATVSLVRLLAEGESVRGRDVRERVVSDRPSGDEREETTGADGTRGPHDGTGGADDPEDRPIGRLLHGVVSGDRGGHATDEARCHAAWLLGELGTATGDPAVIEWLLDALGHADDLVADLAAAYLRRVESPDLERQLRALAEDPGTGEDASERARRVLRRRKRRTADRVTDRALEYVYVRWPADYTEKHRE